MAVYVINPDNPTREELLAAAEQGHTFIIRKFNFGEYDFINPREVSVDVAIKKAAFCFNEPLDEFEFFSDYKPEKIFPYKVEII